MARSNVATVEVEGDQVDPNEVESAENPYIGFTSAKGDEYGMFFRQYPIQSVIAYFTRGIKHAWQNEPASSAGKEVETLLGITKDTPKVDKTRMMEAFRNDREIEWNDLLDAQQLKRWTAIINGEVEAGTRVARDEVEKKYLELVDKAIKLKLKPEKDPNGNPLKLPTNDKDIIIFANGMERTRVQMRTNIANALSDPSDTDSPTVGQLLRTEAEELVAREKNAVKTVPTGTGDPTKSGL